MKKTILTLALAFIASNVAHAEQVCGLLTKQMSSPACEAGEVCSHEVSVHYVLENDDGKIELGAPNAKILRKFSQFQGLNVCATGSVNSKSGEMLVRSISLMNTVREN